MASSTPAADAALDTAPDTASGAGGGRRSGRRPGDSGTREAVLAAARRRFAADGFTSATIRGIAGDAEVDPALVLHFFGSKDKLFAAALELPEVLPGRLAEALEGDPATAVPRFVSAYLDLWEDPATAIPLRAMFRSATTNEQAAATLRDFLQTNLTSRRPALDPARRTTLALMAAQLMGVATARYIIQIEPLASLPLPQLVDRLTRSLTALVAPDGAVPASPVPGSEAGAPAPGASTA